MGWGLTILPATRNRYFHGSKQKEIRTKRTSQLFKLSYDGLDHNGIHNNC